MQFSGRNRTVIDGPFTETKELVAGFWLWQVRSIDEAVRMGQALSQSHAGGLGNRDSPAIRDGRLHVTEFNPRAGFGSYFGRADIPTRPCDELHVVDRRTRGSASDPHRGRGPRACTTAW